MVKVTYIQPNGTPRELDVQEGWTLMQAATTNGVDGIEGECGGSCACATCHCYVDEKTAPLLPPPGETELGLLEMTAAERKPTSRLSCQIKASAAIDGIVLTLPERQS